MAPSSFLSLKSLLPFASPIRERSHPVRAPMDEIILNYWIRSERPKPVFLVKISNTATVYDLQKVIKNEHSPDFRDVPAFWLTLYKPKDPVSAPHEDHLCKLTLSENAECLGGVEKLLVYFPEQPTKGDIHIIVDVPSEIVCWLRGTTLNDSFTLPTPPGVRVDQLRDTIKDKLPSLRNTAVYLIHFYKISGDKDELQESLDEPGRGELLRLEDLAVNFLDVPVLNRLQVVVETPTTKGAQDRKRKRKGDDGNSPFDESTLTPALLHDAFETFKDQCREEQLVTFPVELGPMAYELHLPVESRKSAVFSATISSRKCIIKFTRPQYSEEAHRYLASRGLAPKIWKCVEMSADWTAVVMEKSEYQVLYDMSLSKAEQEKVKRKVKNIVQTLHDGQFVHGDIRDVNLLVDYPSLASDDVTVHLIDFDWAGRTGEARYSIGINCETVKRPEGVKGGELITEQHDDEMVSYLFQD